MRRGVKKFRGIFFGIIGQFFGSEPLKGVVWFSVSPIYLGILGKGGGHGLLGYLRKLGYLGGCGLLSGLDTIEN